MLQTSLYKQIFLCVMGLCLSSQAKENDSIQKYRSMWQLGVFAELGLEYIDNSYFSRVSTQDNIWNQEIKKRNEIELGFKFKPQKNIRFKFEVEFDRNEPQPEVKDFWLKFKFKKKQSFTLGYAKNELGLIHNLSKKQRFNVSKTFGQKFIKTSQALERDLGLEYKKSFRKKGKGFGFSFRGSADDGKNIYENTSLQYQAKAFRLKLDYIGVFSERKEYDLSLYNQIAALSGEYFTDTILKNVPAYRMSNAFFIGDDIQANRQTALLGESTKEYFSLLEQKHGFAVKHDYSFLKASQYVIGASIINPQQWRHFEAIGGVNLYMTETGLLAWKSEFLYRFLSKEGFTVVSALQFFW